MTQCRSTKARAPRAAPLLAAAFVLLILPGTGVAKDRLQVVSSFSVIDDWVREVGGEQVERRSLAPVGAEVHEWELNPGNFVALEEADIVFLNGLQLEQWLGQVEATVADDTPIVLIAEEAGYPTQPIRIGEFEGDPDPHQWMDPRAAREQVAVIAEALAQADPDNAEAYRSNAAAYRDELAALHEELGERLAAIPRERRTLITSESAFPYFADAYDFFHDGIWGSNAEDEGTPGQIVRIIDLVTERQPAALFWESTISDRYVRSVAEDTDTPIAGPLYVDSLGAADSDAATYLDMMRANAELLVDTLAE